MNTLNLDRMARAAEDLKARTPVDYRYGGNCGVLAVAICANVSFEKAWKACRMAPRSKGGTNSYQRIVALKTLGIKHEEKIHYRHGDRHSVRVFARDWAAPGVTYMLTCNRHVVTVKDGMVTDQSGTKTALTHWTRGQIVRRSVRIFEKETT